MSVIFDMFDAGEVSPPQQCGVHTDTHSHFVKEKMSAKISTLTFFTHNFLLDKMLNARSISDFIMVSELDTRMFHMTSMQK